ncbi:MAG: EpsG family protein [Bacteroidales bacterium]|jgi:hypothetical protein|nr:EpsG family protein [Bacteroidales bacterium]
MLILHFRIGSVKNSLISYSILQEGLVLFLLIFFIAFRAFVSTDWMSYYRLYNMMPPISSDFNDFYKTLKETNLEYLFLLLASICKRISPDYFFFQSILCIIDLIILFIILDLFNNIKNAIITA